MDGGGGRRGAPQDHEGHAAPVHCEGWEDSNVRPKMIGGRVHASVRARVSAPVPYSIINVTREREREQIGVCGAHRPRHDVNAGVPDARREYTLQRIQSPENTLSREGSPERMRSLENTISREYDL